jgi:hypothetical protein
MDKETKAQDRVGSPLSDVFLFLEIDTGHAGEL